MCPFPAKAADIVIMLYPAIGTVTTFCAVSTSFAGRNAGQHRQPNQNRRLRP
jgi:hypothetical protein